MPKSDDNVRHTQSHLGTILWSILILATLFLCYFHNLGTIGLVGPDEPRYAWIARDMAESGDWITPRLYGQPWFEKPVLYYWAAALSFKLFAVSDTAARLPSAISALLATLAMAWLAWRVNGAETARWLLLLLPTTIGMLGFSHAAAPDMPFAATLSLALVCATVILGLTRNADSPVLPRTPWLALLLFGFFLGLAVLAKGPAAVILMGGAVLLWAAFTSRWSDMFRCLHPAAIASFCLTTLPWYIVCARHNPDFFRVFIIEHNFKRYLTPEFQHVQPFWYYVPILLIAFAPWTLALLWSAISGSADYWKSRHLSPTTLLLLCWSVFCLLFFSISKSKLPGYILPAIPAIGLLLAHSYVRLSASSEKLFQWMHIAFAFCSMIAGFLLMGFGPSLRSHRINPATAFSTASVLLCFAIANLLLIYRREATSHRIAVNSFCVVPVLALLFQFPQLSAPWLSSDPSGRTLARDLIESGVSLDQVSILKMNRGQEYSLNFYLHHKLRNWDEGNRWQDYLLVAPKTFGGFVAPPTRCSEQSKGLRISGWYLCKLERVKPKDE